MINGFQVLIDDFMRLISSVKFTDILDIAIIAFTVYYSIKLLRQTRAFQLVKGIVLIFILNVIISALNMSASSFILNIIFNDIALVIILLFQPEIRQVIENFGRGNIKKFNIFSPKSKDDMKQQYEISSVEISKAVAKMSENKIGALIVIEGKTLLGEIIETGNEVDAKVTSQVLQNIFFPNSPLHDGAVVIRDARINSAGCILPLTKNEIGKELGTRHRAAVGMSEVSDALIIVVSEETGKISLVKESKLTRGVTVGEVREMILDFTVTDENEKSLFKFNWRKDNESK